ERVRSLSGALVFPALLTLSILNCKTVGTRTTEPTSEENRRYTRRNNNPPLRSFKTLDIRPMREVLRREGGSEAVGVKRALHVCRGHFAVYDEKPLFGKYRGTFWVPNHLRGTPERGAVEKDYRVHPPAGPARSGAGTDG